MNRIPSTGLNRHNFLVAAARATLPIAAAWAQTTSTPEQAP